MAGPVGTVFTSARLGVAFVAAVGIATAIWWIQTDGGDGSETVTETAVEAPEPEAEAQTEAVAEAPEAEAETQQEPEAEVVTAPDPIVPEFDVVRVEEDGRGLVAGSAAPGAKVEVLLDGNVLGDTEADGTGGFVAILNFGLSDQPRTVSLLSTLGDQVVASTQSVILAPTPPVQVADAPVEETAPEGASEEAVSEESTESANVDTPSDEAVEEAPAEETIAEVAGDAATETAPGGDVQPASPLTELAGLGAAASTGDTAPALGGGSGNSPTALAQPAAPTLGTAEDDRPLVPAAPAPPTVLLADEDGVRVLQSSDQAPEVQESVTVDTITYNTEGEVVLAGRGQSEDRFVRVYIDNNPIRDLQIEEGGNWRTPLPDVDTGVYTLRVDEIDPGTGRVTSRIETPFKREPAAAILALAAERRETNVPVQLVTIQPGNTLWQLSEQAYGEGGFFVKIFEANADRIKDPDLIYPGQVFSLPE